MAQAGVFPAIALGRDLSRGYRVEMATDVRGTLRTEKYGIKVHVLKSGTLGSGLLGKIKGNIARAGRVAGP